MITKSIRALARNPIVLTVPLFLAFASPAAAAVPGVSKFDGADTAWLLLSAALVLMVTIQWVLFGYSRAVAPGGALGGALSWAGLSGVSAAQPYAPWSATVPHQAYMIYQCMFAVITPALITGAIAER